MTVKRQVAVRASSTTELAFGLLRAPEIKLFKTTGDETELAKFDGRAGPRGGRLETRYRPVEGADVAIPAPPVAGRVDIEMHAPEWARRPPVAEVPTEPFTVEVVDGKPETEVTSEDVRRGLWVDGKFVDCTEQLDVIEEETKLERMWVESFIPARNVPRHWITASYYVAPSDRYGLHVLGLLYAAVRAKDRAAIVRWTAKTRQSLGVLRATPDGLVVHKVVWGEQVREVPESAKQVVEQALVASEAEVAATMALVREMSEPGRDVLDELRDPAVFLREQLREAALEGRQARPVLAKPKQFREARSLLELVRESFGRLAS